MRDTNRQPLIRRSNIVRRYSNQGNLINITVPVSFGEVIDKLTIL